MLLWTAASGGCCTPRLWTWFHDRRSRPVTACEPPVPPAALARAGAAEDGTVWLDVLYRPPDGEAVLLRFTLREDGPARPREVALPVAGRPPWVPPAELAAAWGAWPRDLHEIEAVAGPDAAGPHPPARLWACLVAGDVELRAPDGGRVLVARLPSLPAASHVVRHEAVLGAYVAFVAGLPLAVALDLAMFAGWMVVKWIGSVGANGFPVHRLR